MLTDINILHKRPEGMDYETYREERRSCNKALKSYLRGRRDEQQGGRSTRYNTIRQLEKYMLEGWSELAPNEKKFKELLVEIDEHERRKDTHRDDISQRGVGGIDIPAADAKSVAD
ncbi:hypothetical protein EBQ93_01150 [bacterium]|jgi:hypothetical protein|nr:hypothetical protein [bacterium]